MEPIGFQTAPNQYSHWRAEYDGRVARLSMQVDPSRPLQPGYELKLNSYDLGVDIELADFLRRLRFEHPEVNTLVLTSGNPEVFCAGANIQMLGGATHHWKVNFCKFTNETRSELERLGTRSGVRTLAAVNGSCAGGGYELAMACDEIWLVDDGNSAVSLPETPMLGVLPGTGGLTRLVDKRKVRRDRADVFCTRVEGMRANRAIAWGLIDRLAPRSRFDEEVAARAAELAQRSDPSARQGIALGPIEVTIDDDTRRYSTLEIRFDAARRTAELLIRGPTAPGDRGGGDPLPTRIDEIHDQGDRFWPLCLARELDDALCDLRINHPEIGLTIVKTEGPIDAVVAYDELLLALRQDWLVGEVTQLLASALQRMERTACSFFAQIDAGSCFAGSLLDVALCCDRIYMLDEDGVEIARTAMNDGPLPMTNGLDRTACRLLGEPELVEKLRDGSASGGCAKMDAEAADRAGLVTEILDEIDFADTLRIASEERVSLNPDALTGMEANLRFAGPETLETKVFGRLSAWQNWIFLRPNATGETGALTLYGTPERPDFDWRRV